MNSYWLEAVVIPNIPSSRQPIRVGSPSSTKGVILFTDDDRRELEGQAKNFGELIGSLRELKDFVQEALDADDVSEDWQLEYEARLFGFMVEFAAKFAEAPNATSETSGSGTEIRENHQGSNSQATEDDTAEETSATTEEEEVDE